METQRVKSQSSAGNDYVKSFFKNLFNFKGKATRPEFWSGILLCMGLYVCIAIIGSIIGFIILDSFNMIDDEFNIDDKIILVCFCTITLFFFVVLTALVIRRLRDSGTNIKWGVAFICLAPFTLLGGGILYMMFTDELFSWTRFIRFFSYSIWEKQVSYGLLAVCSIVSFIAFIPVSIKTLMGLCKKSKP